MKELYRKSRSPATSWSPPAWSGCFSFSGSSCVLWHELLLFKQLVVLCCFPNGILGNPRGHQIFDFKMPERYDLWGSISTLHPVLEWCYVQHDKIVKMTRPMQDERTINHTSYVHHVRQWFSTCKTIAGKRGHNIASLTLQYSTEITWTLWKNDSNNFSVWSFQYENLNHLLFKRVRLLGSSIKATSFQKPIWRGEPVDPGAHRRHRPPSSQAHPDPQQDLLDGTWDMIDIVYELGWWKLRTSCDWTKILISWTNGFS